MPTVSPNYMQKGTLNPFYTVTSIIQSSVERKLKSKNVKFKKIVFKCVDTVFGETVYDSKGKFLFQLTDDKKTVMPYNVKLSKKDVTGHFGMATRKDSTASSNVNEYLTVHFLVNTFNGVKELENDSCKLKNKKTGVKSGEGKDIKFEDLCELIDKDETAERDIKIGYQNSEAVKKDIKGLGKIKNLYWVPRGKPKGISPKTPSDVIIEFANGDFVGYSNKIAAGKDETPKFNTNITAFYGKLEDNKQLKNIEKIIDNSWNDAEKDIPSSKKNAIGAIKSFDITKEPFSESASKEKFAKLSEAFKLDSLDFYGSGFYYNFRNNLIKSLGKYLTNPSNLIYFLNTIYFYTYDDPRMNYVPCPYKLLIGRENRESEIKDVSENADLKNILMNKKDKDLKKIKFMYDNQSQSFKINFEYRKMKVVMPITCRTRAAGGWSGKSLFINTPGLKIL